MENNPFAQLFASPAAAKEYSEKCNKISNQDQADVINKSEPKSELSMPPQILSINEKIEKCFGITINPASKNKVVFLMDVVNDPNQTWIDADTLEQALFERLILEEPEKHLLNNTNDVPEFVTEKNVITYLYQCYCNITNITQSQSNHKHVLFHSMIDLIVRNMSTALKQPEIYSQQNLIAQLSEVLGGGTDPVFLSDRQPFLDKLVAEITRHEDDSKAIVFQVFAPYFQYLRLITFNATITSFQKNIVIGGLLLCARNKLTADALITCSTPTSGNMYVITLLGSIFSLSCLPKTEGGEYLFFRKGEIGDHVRSSVWLAIADISKCLHDIFISLFKVCPEVKEKSLKWIGDCLIANESRGGLWSTQGMEIPQNIVSDAFMINFASVLLRLAEPIISNPKNKKFLKIDPTFGVTEGFEKKTCLIPTEEGVDRPKAETFNFITTIFFLAQKAVDLGFRVGFERLMKEGQQIHTLQETLQNANDGANSSDFMEMMTLTVEKKAAQFHSLRAALTEPTSFSLLMDLTVCTAEWLVQVLLEPDTQPRKTYEITQVRQLTFPLPEHVPATFTCIPEFFIENINCILPAPRRYNADNLDTRELEVFVPVVTSFIVLTRGNERVKNPHLRAGMVESLECLLPKDTDVSAFAKQQIFLSHPLRKEIIPSLLDVFVSIEMPGESAQFDMKFKYRQPIYVLIEFLWKHEIHRQVFKKLAVEAEENIEAVNPPIFLKFLNLLINDAVYLLDEALSNMAQIRTMQQARAAGEWASLPARERSQNEGTLTHYGMMAKFDNILGKWTIKTLENLTTEIKTIFYHPTIVDRIASMLNYFLHKLVGPNAKNFKVKDMNEYKFEPGMFVFLISKIYVNLGESLEFCTAVSQDGRSYNSMLFVRAEVVLCRTGGTAISADLLAVAERIKEMANKEKQKEEMLADAPEEFLDPIMSIIMTDPVTLPTSHVTVDRTTIARHLLSDQTDPFNRSPLTLEMVQRNDELREKIHAWIESRCRTSAAEES